MTERAYLVAYIGFNGNNSMNGAAIIASTPSTVDRDAVEICKPMVLEQYREQFAVTSIIPLTRNVVTRDVYGKVSTLYALLLRTT